MAEPIDLDKLSVALAASMVSAHRYLLQANQDLGDLYAGDDRLAELPRPRFTLGDVKFEVPFVVAGVATSGTAIPPDVRVGKDVVLSESETASLKRGADARSQEKLDTLLSDYALVKRNLRIAVSGTDAGRSTKATTTTPLKLRLAPVVDIPDDVRVQLDTGSSKAAQAKLALLMEDYEAARSSLVRIQEVVAGGALPRLSVRIDPESIAKDPGSVHRMTLQFGSDDQDPIKVLGQTLS